VFDLATGAAILPLHVRASLAPLLRTAPSHPSNAMACLVYWHGRGRRANCNRSAQPRRGPSSNQRQELLQRCGAAVLAAQGQVLRSAGCGPTATPRTVHPAMASCNCNAEASRGLRPRYGRKQRPPSGGFRFRVPSSGLPVMRTRSLAPCGGGREKQGPKLAFVVQVEGVHLAKFPGPHQKKNPRWIQGVKSAGVASEYILRTTRVGDRTRPADNQIQHPWRL